ncbi:hypothetical protein [Streptomyces acidicola]|uniref:Uncharacterized protein n=1 Tax=Streptomyces acidicola TaxID=2596892 RepID=A0A5N8X3U1_9ACTN|nr:hypothetical protein [Streptomyces acidicola]MPY53548.1 hypothetical protein [Streptomyces acidicola]
MAHETSGPRTRDRTAHQDGRHAPYEDHEREPMDMPELHGTQEEPRRSYDDGWDADIREGYR